MTKRFVILFILCATSRKKDLSACIKYLNNTKLRCILLNYDSPLCVCECATSVNKYFKHAPKENATENPFGAKLNHLKMPTRDIKSA